MTRDEFVQKFGNVEVTLSRYYKYTFTFSCEGLDVDAGGNTDSIYRADLGKGPVRVRILDKECSLRRAEWIPLLFRHLVEYDTIGTKRVQWDEFGQEEAWDKP